MGSRSSLRSLVTAQARSFTVYSGVLVSAVLVLSAAVVAFAAMTGSGSYPPPATGAFAYNTFVPPTPAGSAYVDPVFGETVRRLTSDHGHDDIYARNMWWSADETRYLHRTNSVAGKADKWDVINAATGVVT